MSLLRLHNKCCILFSNAPTRSSPLQPVPTTRYCTCIHLSSNVHPVCPPHSRFPANGPLTVQTPHSFNLNFLPQFHPTKEGRENQFHSPSLLDGVFLFAKWRAAGRFLEAYCVFLSFICRHRSQLHKLFSLALQTSSPNKSKIL